MENSAKQSKLKSQTTQIKLTTTQDTKEKYQAQSIQKKIMSRPQTAQCRRSKTPTQSQVTYLTEKSFQLSKEKETFYYETVQNKNFLQATKLKPTSQSNSLFINNQLSMFADEYLMDSYLMPQKKQPAEENKHQNYNNFQQKFLKRVFDSNGEFLLHRNYKIQPNEQNDNSYIDNRQNLCNTIQEKIQKQNHKSILTNINKNNDRKKKHIPYSRTQIFNEMSKKVKENLKLRVKKMFNLETAQNEQKTIKEKVQTMEVLLHESEKHQQVANQETSSFKQKIDSLDDENHELIQKNSALIRRVATLNTANESLHITAQSVSEFTQQLQELKRRFPDYTLQKLMARLEYLEGKSAEFAMIINNLEADKLELQLTIQKLEKKIENMQEEVTQYKVDLQKKQDDHKEKLMKKVDVESLLPNYQDMYLQLQNQVIDLYNTWKTKTPLYNMQSYEKDKLNMQLNTPLDMVYVLKKCVNINTPEKTQKYLRKILVDINIMARKYLNFDCKCRFTPEIIIEKLDLYIKGLAAKHSAFQNSRKTMQF